MTEPWRVVFNSGGIGSWAAAERVKKRYGTERLVHLFTDTKSEDEDLYRFLKETTAATGGEVVWLADGRDLWELFDDNKMIANTRADICSRVLKRDLARKYIENRWKPDECVLYFGIDHSERERFYGDGKKKVGIRKRWEPYTAEAPLCDEFPYPTKCDLLAELDRVGIEPPRMYAEGFPHNNCGGFCVKGGMAHFLHLMRVRPELFAYHAGKEEEFRQRTGKDVAVMRDRRGGVSKPLPMYEFKRQVECGERTVNPRDWGKGCRCFFPDDAEAEDGGAG